MLMYFGREEITVIIATNPWTHTQRSEIDKPMNYTIQLFTDSGCFSVPGADEVEHVKSKKEIQSALEAWKDEVDRFSEGAVYALVWHGHLQDVQDVYPEAQASLGKRGGLHLSPV